MVTKAKARTTEEIHSPSSNPFIARGIGKISMQDIGPFIVGEHGRPTVPDQESPTMLLTEVATPRSRSPRCSGCSDHRCSGRRDYRRLSLLLSFVDPGRAVSAAGEPFTTDTQAHAIWEKLYSIELPATIAFITRPSEENSDRMVYDVVRVTDAK